MSRLPAVGFSVLLVATVAAFFITQHLKVTTPLVAGFPRPVPAVINPVDGTTCGGVDHRRMQISFYLLHSADDVDVYVVDSSGSIVRTLASGVQMQIKKRRLFTWDGREDDGSFAPDGVYYVKVSLIHQDRTVTISGPSGPESFMIKTTFPKPRITSITPDAIPAGARASVVIRYTGNEHRGGTVLIYNKGVSGRSRLVKSFLTPWHGHSAVWDGLIHKRPAPAGTYVIALEVTDAACNRGVSPGVGFTIQ